MLLLSSAAPCVSSANANMQVKAHHCRKSLGQPQSMHLSSPFPTQGHLAPGCILLSHGRRQASRAVLRDSHRPGTAAISKSVDTSRGAQPLHLRRVGA